MVIHVIKPQETIFSIAREYGVSAERLAFDNQVENTGNLVVGQALLVLIPSQVHIVQENDTLYAISQRYQVSILSLIRNNPFIIEQNGIFIGQTLIIRYTDQKKGSIATGGYVYPYVNRDVLTQTLPFLTTISIFNYGFTMEGDLIPIDDEEIIRMAIDNGVDPVLVLAPMDSAGQFNNELVTAISQNLEVQQRVIDGLVVTVTNKNYAGVNIDFEFIKGSDAQGFASFVEQLRIAMNALGYFVTVCLAPKTSANQPGLLYEGMNYALLGAASNGAFLMTYEWGYTYGPPMAVAPLNKVREVVEFAVTQIPAEKLDLGMANYCYDWALPFVQGESRAQSMGLNEAVQLAALNGATIEFDEIAQSPFYYYTNNGVEHVVWFEDVRSILGKLELRDEKSLNGVGFWQLMRYFRPNWMLINALYEIE